MGRALRNAPAVFDIRHSTYSPPHPAPPPPRPHRHPSVRSAGVLHLPPAPTWDWSDFIQETGPAVGFRREKCTFTADTAVFLGSLRIKAQL
ncbi:hypothetical protein RRG08_016274 [Elysia crispata]|uniref:Uncharacterized protein n=1 Tax=Elysia crispata TaxID=231223 RepID=A0AAE1E072_9GAST|nr:hypothetical protein RRG08_016274 [Elysia crispata]